MENEYYNFMIGEWTNNIKLKLGKHELAPCQYGVVGPGNYFYFQQKKTGIHTFLSKTFFFENFLSIKSRTSV